MLQKKTTTAVWPTMPPSDDNSGVRHGFETKALLPLSQSVQAVSYNTTRYWYWERERERERERGINKPICTLNIYIWTGVHYHQ